MAGWGGDPVLGEIGDDDLLRSRVLCDEAGVMEGEDGVKRAVATALDAAFSSLLHDVGIVPAEVGGDTSERGAVELSTPGEDGGAVGPYDGGARGWTLGSRI